MIVAFISVCAAFVVAEAAAPSADDAAMKRALEVLAGLQAGSVDRTQLAPDLDALLTPTVLATDRRDLPAGAPSAVTLRAKTDVDGTTTSVYRLRWTNAAIDFTFGVDDATGKIDTLFVRPGPP